MYTLALESSTAQGSVALLQDEHVLCSRVSLRQRSHSEFLNPFIDECLKEASLQLADIDLYAVGHGPGSFTGIRIAANIGKTFAYSFQKPLYWRDSLSLLVDPIPAEFKRVATMINAYKNMVYFNLFENQNSKWIALHKPMAIGIQELDQYIQDSCYCVGDGFKDYYIYFHPGLKSLLKRDEALSDYPHAMNLGLQAYLAAKQGETKNWNLYTPLYLKASAAEENLRK